MPLCDPVKDMASHPISLIAIESSAMEIRSPAVSNMSSSRLGGWDDTVLARSIRWSVVSPMAETTTTTSLPSRFSLVRYAATLRIFSGEASDVPPNFLTASVPDFTLATPPTALYY